MYSVGVICMSEENSLKIFEDKNIRVQWDADKELWYFSVVDIVTVLTDSDYQKARNYWKWLKNKLNEEGSELVSNTNQLKMKAHDGKMRDTDVMDTEQILRLIQSIPSKKAEPFKLWLAKVGKERIDETYDPELAINRALDTYRKKGYSEDWINQRLKTTNTVVKGATVAKKARINIEEELGRKIVTEKNANEIRKLNSNNNEAV